MRREKAEERDNRQSKKLLQRVDDGTDLVPQGISNSEHLTDQPTPRKRNTLTFFVTLGMVPL